MISSMTGYGKGSAQREDLLVEVEIKSLNSRYLDLSLRLPKFLYDKEFEIREKIKSRIKRGKIYLNISFKKNDEDEKINIVDKNAVKSTVKILKEIRKTAGLRDKIKLTDILQFQNLFLKEELEENNDDMELVLKAIDNAIDELNKMRFAEGYELEKDIRKRLQLIEDAVNKIESIQEKSLNSYFEKFRERAKQLTSDFIDNEQRLITELALLAERFDVTEECVRMKSHIKMFLDTIENTDDAGRKLNFILQEMNREANTINSKSVSAEISHAGISIKEEIEKIREQIQNIE